MRLKNVLIVVKDIEVSKTFYKELFGLHVLTDFGQNAILTEGLVLQERASWEDLIGKEMGPCNHAMELYFEDSDLTAFLRKLEASSYEIQYVTPPMEYYGGKKVVRFYDPDKHVIEVSEKV